MGCVLRQSQKLGFADVKMELEDGQICKHTFTVLDSPEPTVILGREFLRGFNSFEIDWDRRRVRLGNSWLETVASARGGIITTGTSSGSKSSVN